MQRHIDPQPSGLHGPYDSADEAATEAAPIAMAKTKEASLKNLSPTEFGFYILRDSRTLTGSYYSAPPTMSSQESGNFTQVKVLREDYNKSIGTAFNDSCEEVSNFVISASAHTHPLTESKQFSMQDYNHAIEHYEKKWVKDKSGKEQKGKLNVGSGVELNNEYEKAFLVRSAAPCIDGFVPQQGDRYFTWYEKWLVALASFNDLFSEYSSRQTPLGCFREKK